MFSQIDSMLGMLNDARAHVGCLMSSNFSGSDISRASLVFNLLCEVQMQLIRLRADFILEQKNFVLNEACLKEEDCRALKVAAM
jgi:hypothetical protein